MNETLCRLCCQNNGSTHIFSKVKDIVLCTKIMYCCSNLNIKDGDGLPSHICSSCESELALCYQFVLKCEASDKKLRSQSLEINSRVLSESSPKIEVKLECNSDDDRYYNDFQNEIQLEAEHGQLEIKLECAVSKITAQRKSAKQKCKYKSVQSCTCLVCGRQCANPSTFKIHMRSHTNEKPYACPSCEKCYKDRGTLKRHIERTHLPQKRQRNFICENWAKVSFPRMM